MPDIAWSSSTAGPYWISTRCELAIVVGRGSGALGAGLSCDLDQKCGPWKGGFFRRRDGNPRVAKRRILGDPRPDRRHDPLLENATKRPRAARGVISELRE